MREMWGGGKEGQYSDNNWRNTEKTISEQPGKCRQWLAVGTQVILLEIWLDVHHRDSSGSRSVDCVKTEYL